MKNAFQKSNPIIPFHNLFQKHSGVGCEVGVGTITIMRFIAIFPFKDIFMPTNPQLFANTLV
jgi:hypothetical protein